MLENQNIIERLQLAEHAELETMSGSKRAGFSAFCVELSLDLAADTAEEKLYKESFGPDAHPGQRMTSSNPWETCVCGPAHFSDGRLLGEALHAARMEKKDAKTPSGK